MDDSLKTVSLETMINKHIGERGTPKREVFENELRIDLLGESIKMMPKRLHTTSEVSRKRGRRLV